MSCEVVAQLQEIIESSLNSAERVSDPCNYEPPIE